MLLPAPGFCQTASEYAIKATYIARFTEFIEWPKEDPDDTSEAITVSIIGKTPHRDILERTFRELKVGTKRVEIRYVSSVEESEGSEILFIAASEEKKVEGIVSYTKDKPILTISDTKGFAERGVIINFYQVRRKVRFEINPSALEDTGLRISSLLLNSARIVEPKKDSP
jgi:hypothetical protein